MLGNCGNKIIYVVKEHEHHHEHHHEPPHGHKPCEEKPKPKPQNPCECPSYAEPKVTLELNSPHEYENGEVVTLLNFSWTYNKTEDTLMAQDINGQNLDTSLRTLNLETNIEKDTLYTLTVNDGSSTASDSVGVRFRDYVYCGVGEDMPTLTKIPYCKASFTAGEGEYLWIFIPKSTGISKILFDHNVDVVSDFVAKSYTLTNNAGKSVEGTLYRSVNYSLGTLTLKFK